MSLQQEILNGESRTLEYKVELPEDSEKWVKSIVAFANGAVGKFVVGENNRREFIGIPKKADLFELKDSIADKISQMCVPQIMFDITAEIVEGAQLLIVQVFPGMATPYYIKSQGKENGTYIRLGATTRNADLSTQVIGVSNVSAGINLGHSHLNFLWPPEKNFTNLDSKKLNTFVRTIFAGSDFVKEEYNNLFETFCDEVYHEITRCFDDQGRTDHASTVLRILEEKKEQVFESQEANFFVNIFKDASIGKKYKHSVDNHSIVFDIEKESFYLSDICEDAMDAMFNQCGCRIASQYPLLKSAHHGTRICNDLKKMRFSKIVHCCGKGNRRYGRPLNDYKQMSSTVVYMDAVKAAKQTF